MNMTKRRYNCKGVQHIEDISVITCMIHVISQKQCFSMFTCLPFVGDTVDGLSFNSGPCFIHKKRTLTRTLANATQDLVSVSRIPCRKLVLAYRRVSRRAVFFTVLHQPGTQRYQWELLNEKHTHVIACIKLQTELLFAS
jgi:hypothetical protein